MKLKDFMAAMQAIESDRKLPQEVVVEALQEALAKAFRTGVKRQWDRNESSDV